MPSVIFKSFPVAGTEDTGGDVKVLGKASDGHLDSDGDIISPPAMASAVKEWLRISPDLRVQHADYAAGRGLDAWQDGDGATWVQAVVADGKAKAMVRSGALKAFSVGLNDVVTSPSPLVKRYFITSFKLREISLVSDPANARCGITVCKSVDGVPQFIGKAWDMAGKAGKAEKYLRKAAKLLGVEVSDLEADPTGISKSREVVAAYSALVAEKTLRVHLRTALDSSDPWTREAARKVLRGG